MNPFDLVFDGLWAMAERSVPLTSLVKVGNRIKFNKQQVRSVVKESVQVADLPELMLVTEGNGLINNHSSSCSSMLVRNYYWMLSTGDERVSYLLNPVQWALYCAMIDYDTTLGALVWPETNGETFVKKCDWLALSEGLSNSQANRGIMGWSAVWRMSVEFWFTTQQLRDFNLAP